MIDPVALSLFGIKIHWYGLLWIVGFLLAQFAAVRLGPKLVAPTEFSQQQISDLCLWCLLAAVVGGRIGYVFIYGFDQFVKDPLWLVKIHTGGLAFHGALVAIIAVLIWQAKRHKVALLGLSDVIALGGPLALACGRFGNFVNGELWGRPTELPWGLVFANADALPRHPSQLYEMATEGILLFIILAVVAQRKPPRGLISALFLAGYGLFRFGVEFFREADAHMGYYFLDLTAGQLLCVPMILGGGICAAYVLLRRGPSPSN